MKFTPNYNKISFCKPILISAIALISALALPAQADSHGLYELRTYTANEGKMEALHDRFRNHTMALFEKHGIKNIAYWSPVDDANKLIYIVAHKDAEGAQAAWKAFVSDPEWQKVYADSIADGRLVSNIDSVFMTKTDYSSSSK